MATPPEQRVGATLAQIRQDIGLTQKEVAKAAGLCQRTVSFIETGSRLTRVRDVLALAEAMGHQLLFVPQRKVKN